MHTAQKKKAQFTWKSDSKIKYGKKDENPFLNTYKEYNMPQVSTIVK